MKPNEYQAIRRIFRGFGCLAILALLGAIYWLVHWISEMLAQPI